MSAQKTGRKLRSLYRQHKRKLKKIEAMKIAVIHAQNVIAVAQMAAGRTMTLNKCYKCKHAFEENIGGIASIDKQSLFADECQGIKEDVFNALSNDGITIEAKQ